MNKDSKEYQETIELMKEIFNIDLKPAHLVAIVAHLGMLWFDGNKEMLIEYLEGEKEYDMQKDWEESEND